MKELQLQGDIRRAIENYMGDTVSGPWDTVISTLATVIAESGISIEEANRLNLAFAKLDENAPDACPTCNRGLSQYDGMRW